MKSAIAAFVTAAARQLEAGLPGSISLLITGDEEGPAINGTKKVLEWLQERGETLDACLVGEPTNPDRLGEMIKIGRRGSMNAELAVRGMQGHVAYPHLADNPITRLVNMLAALKAAPLDSGTEHFQPSNLEVTTIDVGNAASNVIPNEARARFNIRFSDLHTSESLRAWIKKTLDAVSPDYDLDIHVTGEAFLTPPGQLSGIIADSVRERLGVEPELSTTAAPRTHASSRTLRPWRSSASSAARCTRSMNTSRSQTLWRWPISTRTSFGATSSALSRRKQPSGRGLAAARSAPRRRGPFSPEQQSRHQASSGHRPRA